MMQDMPLPTYVHIWAVVVLHSYISLAIYGAYPLLHADGS